MSVGTFPTTAPVTKSDLRQNVHVRFITFECHETTSPELRSIIEAVKENHINDLRRYGKASMSAAIPAHLVGDALRTADCLVSTWPRDPAYYMGRSHPQSVTVSVSAIRQAKNLSKRP